MASNELENLFSSTMHGLRDMIDVNTVVGNPIEAPDGTIIIPLTKVSFGFGMGGYNHDSDKDAMQKNNSLAGGSGGGVTVLPVGFLIVGNGSVKILNVDTSSPFDKVIESLPDLIKSAGALFGKSND